MNNYEPKSDFLTYKYSVDANAMLVNWCFYIISANI